MPEPVAFDPVKAQAFIQALNHGFTMCIKRLQADHGWIEAKFLKDLADSLDVLQQRHIIDGQFLQRAGPAFFERSCRNNLRNIGLMVEKSPELMSVVWSYATMVEVMEKKIAAHGDVIGLTTMCVLNLDKFASAQSLERVKDGVTF